MSQTKKDSLGILGWDSFDFFVNDLDRSLQFYTESFGLPLIAQSTERHAAEQGEKTLLFGKNGIAMACIAPTQRDSRAERYLRRHPDGVGVVGLRVRNLDLTHRVLSQRGATFATGLQQGLDHTGNPYRWFEIATPLGEVRYRFVERHVHTLPPGLVPLAHPQGDSQAYQHIDHVTANMLTLQPYMHWLRDVMGFEEYWRVDFHTSDAKGDQGSGLASIVMYDPESKIKMANNEPAIPNFEGSQVYTFVEDNNGPGIQHVAFHVPDIQETVETLQRRGLNFLDVPDTYYEMLPKRLQEHQVNNFTENIARLRELGVLVDGEDGKYLLQLFMKEGALLYDDAQAGPFFYEMIQRKGATLFGEGNFRALFESIERDQLQR